MKQNTQKQKNIGTPPKIGTLLSVSLRWSLGPSYTFIFSDKKIIKGVKTINNNSDNIKYNKTRISINKVVLFLV
tara:strand:+ start:125 stop:346 length:222 start_codon:yes stop_codon:yes gene_type:complete